MLARPSRWTSGLLLAALLTAAMAPSPAQAQDRKARLGDVSAEKVEKSIELGIDFLIRKQDARGDWVARLPGYDGGVSALCALALVSSGVKPDEPAMIRALESIRKRAREPKDTYVVSLQCMVLCAARQKQDIPLIGELVRWLQSSQDVNGGWGYNAGKRSTDPSNSQFALLALHEADLAHESIAKRIDESTWRRALAYWEQQQDVRGAWGYSMGGGGSGSMTSAGIASVVIASSRLSPPGQNESQLDCCAGQTRNNRIDAALRWLGDPGTFSIDHNPGPNAHGNFTYYYLYGLERAGRLTAQRYLGVNDWYRLGVNKLVHEQDKLSGFWKGGGGVEDDPQIATSLALLFLCKGRRPVLLAKLRYGAGPGWNQHPEDAANLTRYVEGKWERDLTWQVVDARTASVDDLLQCPVLYFGGKEAADFDDTQVATLRKYIENGGFIFAEACCGGRGFDDGFRSLIKRMYPDNQNQLLPLPPDHAVWRTEEVIEPKDRVDLWGVNVSCRTSIIYSARDLSCGWQHATQRRMQKLSADSLDRVKAALSTGHNVVAYATNRELKYKFELFDKTANQDPKEQFPRGHLHIALVEHGGGFDAAPQALPNLRRALAKVKNVRVNFEPKTLQLSDDAIFDHPVLFMHGRHQFTLDAAARKNLRLYVERGGVLLVDSVCANEAFARSFREEMFAAFPETKLERIPAEHDLFTRKFGGTNITRVSRREPVRVAPDKPLETQVRENVEPQLEGIKFKDRYGVIFSPYDISCALENHASPDCRGYLHDDALRIGVNVVLYGLYQPGP